MIDLGIRIEFFDEPVELGVEPHRGRMGTLYRDEGYRAFAVPAVGTKLDAVSLRVASRDDFLPLVMQSHLLVHDVWHTPVPVREGSVPTWWDSPVPEPAVTVVLRTKLSPNANAETLLPRVRQYVADGWRVIDTPDGSALDAAWRQAWREYRDGTLARPAG
ncbi:hypothetical protein ACWCQM_36785 [Streptomyces sp. NPDC002125]